MGIVYVEELHEMSKDACKLHCEAVKTWSISSPILTLETSYLALEDQL